MQAMGFAYQPASRLMTPFKAPRKEVTLSYKSILVYLDSGTLLEARLETAARLARQHSASLIGVDVSADEAFEGRSADRAKSLKDFFDGFCRTEGVEGTFRIASAENASHFLVYAADLFIAKESPAESGKLVLPGIPEQPLLHGGVPGLILPTLWREREVGKNVMVTWNASRESNRAIRDALPILQRAEKVFLFAFGGTDATSKADMETIVFRLANHGVKPQVEVWPDTGDMDPVSAMFASLDEYDVDLIVAGAYGHARWFEGLFGGVSKELLTQESMAVLMSH
jgi:nucleotide-binding universal stress UspA family protein